MAVVLSPRNVYFAPLPNRVLAAVYPADRQATARWVRHTLAPQGTTALAPYLKQPGDFLPSDCPLKNISHSEGVPAPVRPGRAWGTKSELVALLLTGWQQREG